MVAVAPIISMSVLIFTTTTMPVRHVTALSRCSVAPVFKIRPKLGFGIRRCYRSLQSSGVCARQEHLHGIVLHVFPERYFNTMVAEKIGTNALYKAEREIFLSNNFRVRHSKGREFDTTTRRLFVDQAMEKSTRKGMSVEEKQMTADCQKIIDAAIDAVDPLKAVQNHISILSNEHENGVDSFVLHIKDSATAENINTKLDYVEYNISNDFQHIFIVSFGKASSAMSFAVMDTFVRSGYPMDKVSGFTICKDGYCTESERTFFNRFNMTIREASHPVPDARAVEASLDLLTELRTTCERQKTLVVACISGGGSSLFRRSC
jgi:Domain of unknown function (DUF4147)